MLDWKVGPNFSTGHQKGRHSNFYLRIIFFEIAPKVTKYLGYFYKKIATKRFQKSPNVVTRQCLSPFNFLSHYFSFSLCLCLRQSRQASLCTWYTKWVYLRYESLVWPAPTLSFALPGTLGPSRYNKKFIFAFAYLMIMMVMYNKQSLRHSFYSSASL